jgi:DNA invertase Pin-like site-specific DNA recombinase
LNAQRIAIQAEAQHRAWKSIRCFIDEGVSASSLDRPDLQHALEILGAGGADILVVSKLDRLSRSLVDFASLMERSQREGWTVDALDFGLDTATIAGGMLARVMTSFARLERKQIFERSSRMIEEAKKRGRRFGRPIMTPERIRRRIARERANGRTLRAIADRLNGDNIRTARGKLWRPVSVGKVLLSIERDRIVWVPLKGVERKKPWIRP